MNTDFIVAKDFIDKHPFSAAQVLDRLNDEEIAEFFQELSIENSLTLLNLMNIDKSAKCFPLLPSQRTKELMESSDLSLAESLCRQFEESFRNSLLARLSPDLAAILRRKLEQVANTVGVLMVTVIAVNKEMTVKTALEIIERNQESLEAYLYVVDSQGTFEGAVRLEELLFTDRNITLGGLMITTIPKFFPDTPIINVLDHPAWYEYRFIPVIDRSEKLLGTLPYRTTKDVTSKKNGQSTKDILATSTALGELYRIGITGFLQGVAK
jgi:Mg/Co/Ni transporter MgtE